jgi:DNA processing protein
MISIVTEHIKELEIMKKYPKELFYKGDLALLKKQKISIVGSRKPNQYARESTHELAYKLSQANICIVSGGAIGTDIIAHKAAGSNNTIMVAGTGLDKHYPAINKNIIKDIESNGLVLSQFKEGTPSQRYNFPLRNELIVALGDILIVMYADENSGTMRSIEYAKKMGKTIYVLPHRIAQSTATNKLLETQEAQAIYDIDNFIEQISNIKQETIKDEFLLYCQKNPIYDEVLIKYASKVFEYEFLGKIEIINGKIIVK